MEAGKELHRVTYVFETIPGGEELSLFTRFVSNGDPMPNGFYINQELTYGNAAIFNFCGPVLTSKDLRELADLLDSAEKSAIVKGCKLEKE